MAMPSQSPLSANVIIPQARWLRGLKIQVRVIVALMFRDALSRFGHDNLGFFWVVAEPMLLTCGVIIMWSVLGMGHGSEIGIIPFALTGYTFITLWRHIVSRSIRILGAKSGLMYHRQIRHLDILIAMAAMELVAALASFVIILTPLTLLGICPLVRDPLLIIVGFVLSTWFAFSFGLCLAALSEVNESAHHFIAPIMYITLPLTGTFAMVDWLPERFQNIVQWSPLVSGIEMIRCGMFSEEIHTHFSVSYLTAFCVVLSSVGLYLVNKVKNHIEN